MPKLTDKELEELYDSGTYRLTQERNDFLLPQILDFVQTKKWLNLHPEYQRRLVWDSKKRSQFIESLLMNLPVPPVFLFEWDYSRYEVIDGQQRLSSITDFYNNRFKLTKLEKWPGLNGKFFADLPPKIQRGLDRRRISAVVLLAENLAQEERKFDVRRMMFERLNTGGLNLRPQELRNCIFSSLFNDMLLRLAAQPLFNDLWDMPRYEDHIRGDHISETLANNSLFKRMGDCEIVLRFFALRKKSNIKGPIKSMLDRCMKEHMEDPEDKINRLESEYMSRLKLCHQAFGEQTFRLPAGENKGKLSQPLYDAVMLAVDSLFSQKDAIIKRRRAMSKTLREFVKNEDYYDLVVARANTADAIKTRLSMVEAIFREVL